MKESGKAGTARTRLKAIIAILAAACFMAAADFLSPLHAKKKGSTEEFSILCMGDILLAEQSEELMELNGKDYPFKKIEEVFKNYNLVFANLEVPITYRGHVHPTKPYTFRLHPDNASYLKKLKINVVSVANNHILDFGRDGMFDTLSLISEWGIKYVGAGKNLLEARTPAVTSVKGIDVVILAYCERPPVDFYATETTPGTAPMRIKMIIEDIEKYKNENNLVLVSLHWGIEHNDFPEKYQVSFAHAIIEAGADAVIGHHPHVPQGIEIYNGKPILYSLGNAVVGFHNPNYKNNMMVSLQYRGNDIQSLKIIPLAGKHKEIKSQPYILQGKDAEVKIEHIKRLSRPFKTEIEYSNDTGNIRVFNNQ